MKLVDGDDDDVDEALVLVMLLQCSQAPMICLVSLIVDDVLLVLGPSSQNPPQWPAEHI
jgi:hypothetical protein